MTGKRVRKERLRTKAKKAVNGTKPAAKQTPGDSKLEAALRAWRLLEAQRLGVPAFRIFTDRVLRELAAERPVTERELLAISGVGMNLVSRYGSEIYRIVGRTN